jgi:Mn-containing catalase
MTREIAHQKSFEKALYAIEPNFPPGKMQGRAEFTSVYFSMSHGGPEIQGAWNSGPKWRVISDPNQQMAVDGGSGGAQVGVTQTEEDLLAQMAARTMSDPGAEPLTGAEIGARITEDVDYADDMEPLDDGTRNARSVGRPAH